MNHNDKQEKTTIERVNPPDLSLAEYGSREDITALARRIKTCCPVATH